MSMSQMSTACCEGCGATADPNISITGTARIPDDWLVVEGPAVGDEVRNSGLNVVERHVCSPVCLVVLAQRLADLPDAIQPAAEVEA